MRILYLHQYFVPPRGAGGTRSYELARRLVARGHEVTLVTSASLFPDRKTLDRTVREQLDGIELVILPVGYDNAMPYAERMRAFARFAALASWEAARVRADLVFATSTPLTIAIPGLVARAATWAPMVFEVRDLWPELPIAIGALRSPVSQALARGLEWIAYHGAAHVVALSPGMAEGVAARGIPRERITVIPNGCDISLFDVTPAEVAAFRARTFPALREGQPLVVYAGTLGRMNGAGWLVDLAAAMRTRAPEVRFAIVGSGAEAEAIEAKARDAGVLDETLWMLPPVPKREMPLLLGAATVATSLFLPLPAMEHNSANKFFDALAAGKPVAINYRGWQAELVEREQAGLVLPYGAPRDAADRLARALADPARLAAFASGARRLARERFDRDRLAERLEHVMITTVRDARSGGKRLRARQQ